MTKNARIANLYVEPSWYLHAVEAFESDSSQARRALVVSMAVNVFGVGKLLPNELGNDTAISRRLEDH